LFACKNVQHQNATEAKHVQKVYNNDIGTLASPLRLLSIILRLEPGARCCWTKGQ